MRARVWGLALALLAGGCIGNIGDRSGSSGSGSGSNPGEVPEELRVGASDLRRLSRAELERTLRDLVGDAAVDAANGALNGLPDDQVAHGFSSMAVGVSATHVDGYFAVAHAVAQYVAADSARRAALAPCLADSPADAACAEQVLDGFGRRVFRRPLTADEKASLLESHAAGAAVSPEDAVSAVLLHLLQSPPFLYRIELDGEAVAGAPDTFALSGYELATRLSYFAWGSTPDDALLDAAASGALDDDAGVEAAVARLFADPRARDRVRWFFAEWLGLDAIPTPQQSDAFLDGIPPGTLADDMREEALRFVEHHVFDAPAAYPALWTSADAFVPSDALAEVYGVAPPSGADGATKLPADRRAGLLTRAALLTSGGEQTHPVKRGAFVLRSLLCQEIAPPDPNDFPPNSIAPPAFDPNLAARDRWTDKTSQPSCVGCHGRLNPYGFALEHYDTLGRWRDEEPIVDPADGTVVNELPIDASVAVTIDGAETTVDGAVGLETAIADSPQANACLSTQWLRFSLGRKETNDDAHLVADLTQAGTADGGTMLETFQALARSKAFRLRKVKP